MPIDPAHHAGAVAMNAQDKARQLEERLEEMEQRLARLEREVLPREPEGDDGV